MLAGAFDGETLFIEEPFNLKNHFDIRPPVKAMAGGALAGLQAGELGFPVAQHIRFGVSKFADFADTKVKLVRDNDPARCVPSVAVVACLAPLQHSPNHE